MERLPTPTVYFTKFELHFFQTSFSLDLSSTTGGHFSISVGMLIFIEARQERCLALKNLKF